RQSSCSIARVRPDTGTTSTSARKHASSARAPSRVKRPSPSRNSEAPRPSRVPSRSVYTQRKGIGAGLSHAASDGCHSVVAHACVGSAAPTGEEGEMAEQVHETVKGDGYAVGSVDGMGEGPGFRKVRRELDVTAFGA